MATTNSNMDEARKTFTGMKRYILWASIIGLALLSFYLILSLIALSLTNNAIYFSIIIKHYPATIGLPIVALTSLVLIYLLEYSRGPIEFEGLGFTFKGAAGPLIFWVICFVAISLSISMLWKSEFNSNIADRVMEEFVVKDSLKQYIDTCQWLKEQQNAKTEEAKVLCAAEAELIFKKAKVRLTEKVAAPLGRVKVTNDAVR